MHHFKTGIRVWPLICLEHGRCFKTAIAGPCSEGDARTNSGQTYRSRPGFPERRCAAVGGVPCHTVSFDSQLSSTLSNSAHATKELGLPTSPDVPRPVPVGPYRRKKGEQCTPEMLEVTGLEPTSSRWRKPPADSPWVFPGPVSPPLQTCIVRPHSSSCSA